MAVDLATLAIKCTTDGVSQAKSGLDDLTRSGANAERQMASTGTASSNMASQIAKLAATVITAAAAYQTLVNVIQTGLRAETMSVVMEQIGKNVGISTKSLEYFRKEVESTGVTGMEAMSALSKAMQLGLNLNEMKEFTTRVRDIAVGARDSEGNLLNTSETLRRVMSGIQSGQVEVLRTMGINVRNTETVYKEFAATIGKTKDQLNDAQKAMAMKNEVMRATIPLAGAAAAADATVGKQIASLPRFIEAAYVELWKLFSPGMYAGVQALTQGFKDLKTWAENNSLALRLMGQRVGEYVISIAGAAGGTLKWAAANFELIRALTELYIISKIMTWINGLQLAIRASTTAVIIFTGVTQGLIPILLGAAYSTTIYTAGLAGMTKATTTATAAGVALNAMMMTVLPAIVAVSAALAIYGAYKSFKGEGDTGQGIGTPGTATMGDDMWDYVQAMEAIPDDPFAGPRESAGTYNKTLADGKILWDAFAEWANKQWTWMVDMTGAKADLLWVQEKIQWIIDTISATKVWDIAVNFIMGSMPTPEGTGESIAYKGGPSKLKLAEKIMFGTGAPSLSDQYSELDTGKMVREDIAKYEAIASSAGALAKPGGAEKAGGGGKSTDAAESAMKSFIESMHTETARAAGDTEAILGAWYGKQLLSIEKWKNAGLDTTKALEAADEAYYSKLEKLNSDFTDWYNSGLGNQYEKLVAEEKKKLDTVTGNKAKEAQVIEVFDRKHFDLSRQIETERLGMVKGYLDTMAGLSPMLADQLGYKREALHLELKLANLALERFIQEKNIGKEEADNLQRTQAYVAQAKKYALEREGWMKGGDSGDFMGSISGGLKAGSLDRDKESATRTAQWTIDAMKGAETWLGETGGQAFVDYLHGKKADLSKMFQDMGDSLIKQLFKMGTTKLFDKIWEGIGGMFNLGKGKPDGSSNNPFHVTFEGLGTKGIGGALPKATHAAYSDRFGRTEPAMQKTGMTVGGGQVGGMDSVAGIKALEKEYTKYFNMRMKDEKALDKLDDKIFKEEKAENKFISKDWMKLQQDKIQYSKEFYNSEQAGQEEYQTSFGTMLSGVSNLWLMGQAAMTAAGVKGDTMRIVSMMGFALKAVSIIANLLDENILAAAKTSAVSAYAWVMKMVPPPLNFPLALAAGALAFAGAIAMGKGGKSSAGGDWSVAETGPRYVHQEETILPAWAAQSWRDIVSRENTGSRPGENGGGNTQVIHLNIDARGAQKGIDWKSITKTQIVPQLQKLNKVNRLRVGK